MKARPLINVEKTASLTGHRDCIYCLEKGMDESHFFSASGDGMVVEWDMKNPELGRLIAQVENSVYALCYLPDTHGLLLGHNFQGIHLIDVASKVELKSAAITTSYIFDIKVIGDNIFVATGEGLLVVLSLSDFTTLARIKLSDQSIRCIAVAPDKKQLAIGCSDNSCTVINTSNYKVLARMEGHANSVFTVAYSPDGQYLLSGSRDAHLKIWEVAAGYKLKESIVAHMYAIHDIKYSPDERYFVTCSMDKSIKVWDAKEFRLLKVIDKARHAGHGTSVNKLYWSTFENKLISCSDDRTISVWTLDELPN